MGVQSTPDQKNRGLDFAEVLDIVLGTPDTLPEWEAALEAWAAEAGALDAHEPAPRRGGGDGPARRVEEAAARRARALLRRRFGDWTRPGGCCAHWPS